jgi:hypothetical protein
MKLWEANFLFPSFTVRSSGGFRESLPFKFEIFCPGVEPVNQTSGSVLSPGLTVARHLDLLFTGKLGLYHR